MIPDPPTADNFLAGGKGSPARDGSGEPSRVAGKVCWIVGCDDDHPRLIKGLCPNHYQQQYRYEKSRLAEKTADGLSPVVVACPDDLIPLVTELVDNDARPIFTLLWRAIGNWHLQGNDIAS